MSTSHGSLDESSTLLHARHHLAVDTEDDSTNGNAGGRRQATGRDPNHGGDRFGLVVVQRDSHLGRAVGLPHDIYAAVDMAAGGDSRNAGARMSRRHSRRAVKDVGKFRLWTVSFSCLSKEQKSLFYI